MKRVAAEDSDLDNSIRLDLSMVLSDGKNGGDTV
jgi:hypothetical protein